MACASFLCKTKIPVGGLHVFAFADAGLENAVRPCACHPVGMNNTIPKLFHISANL